MKKLVTILMPAFNESNTVARSIKSVRRQSYTNWELIVVDDNSVDETNAIVNEFMNIDPRIKLFKNEFKKGAAGSRKTARKHSSGEIIAYLDADDFWGADHLINSVALLETRKAVFSDYLSGSAGGAVAQIRLPEIVSLRALKLSNFIPCLTACHSADLLSWYEYPIIKKRNDYAIWLEIMKRNPDVNFYNTGMVSAQYTVSSTGLSANKFDAIKYAFLNLKSSFGIFQGLFFTISHILFAVLKKGCPDVYSRMVCKLVTYL